MYKEKYNEWLHSDKLDEKTREILKNMSEDEIEDSFFKDIEFGTGGIRGVLGIGTNRLNIYNIRRINYGFGQYLVENLPGAKEQGIVIAHDNRHMSKEFTLESARVLNSFGIKVYLFPELAPTPQLSYAVRYLNAAGGIVITASHNPPQYNGYKLYNDLGCQLVPHEANKVVDYINNLPPALEISIPDNTKENIIYLDDEIDTKFLEMVTDISIKKNAKKENLKVVFSPQHGTSYKLAKKMLEDEKYDLILVKEQCTPDPDFTNTKSPNPEEPAAFELSIKYAKQADADICVTTDPDADRVGLACKDSNGEYQLLTGNQMGALFLDYIIKNSDVDLSKSYAVSTVVTSDIGMQICKMNNIHLDVVLTGFKFIGDVIHKYEENQPEKKFFFGYEESYGYLFSDQVRDKDALQAVFMACEMAAVYKEQGISLLEKLEAIYQEYGYYMDQLLNFKMSGSEGMEKIAEIMKSLRESGIDEMGGIKVTETQDFGKSIMGLPKADVIKMYLEDESFVAFRPSGTEPKFKVYCCIKDTSKENASAKFEKIKIDIEKIIKG
ncbi:MAG: phospho-sugar mutase [Eubacteriales bacterium]